ncbi:hypothetical protein WUBG_15696, partial [Wuchereria bancrofti]
RYLRLERDLENNCLKTPLIASKFTRILSVYHLSLIATTNLKQGKLHKFRYIALIALKESCIDSSII